MSVSDSRTLPRENKQEFINPPKLDIMKRPEGLIVSLGFEESVADGILSEDGDETVAAMESLQVDPSNRNQGIGERLTRNFIAVSQDLGATRFEASVVSPHALRIMAKIFGESGLTVQREKTGKYLPVSFAEALANLEEYEANYGNYLDSYEEPEKSPGIFAVTASLKAVDTTSWERPLSSIGLQPTS